MPHLIWSFLLFTVVVVVTPGANNVLAATSGTQFGLRASAGLLLGLGFGVVSLVVISAVGLGFLVTSVPTTQSVLRVTGTAYLVWLAVQIARSGRPDTGHTLQTSRDFRSGLLVSWLNPKVWLVGLSAVANYSTISSSPVVLASVFGGIFSVVVAANLMLWCTAGQLIAKRVSTDRQWRTLNMTLATLLVASVATIWLD